jgi:riboflavin biosynthesis pyrimidine reductase
MTPTMETRNLHAPVTRLWPASAQSLPLAGLYLAHKLHTLARNSTIPLVYSNFISSLDGRIAVEVAGRDTYTVPDSIANSRDWRLYQELAGQADILVTSGRFFRQYKAGEAQDHLPVGSQPGFDDIRRWRTTQGLTAQPDIVILSSSLDIPQAALEAYRSRRIIVATGATTDKTRAQLLERSGIEVITAGAGKYVDGKRLVQLLGTKGYRSLYAIAGPAVLHTLVQAEVLQRLYLTIACRLLGGNAFDTLLRGMPFTPAVGMQLTELYHDSFAPPDAGQLFCVFDRTVAPEPSGYSEAS